MITCDTLNELEDAIRQALEGKNKYVISIDGFDRVGKSFVSERLGLAIGIPVIDLDCMLSDDHRSDVSPTKLQSAVSKAFVTASAVIVNGVLVLHDIKRAQLKSDLAVYVKAIRETSRIWVHKGWVNATDEEILVARNGGYPIEGVYPSNLIDKCSRYHRTYTPHLNADIVFLNSHWY